MILFANNNITQALLLKTAGKRKAVKSGEKKMEHRAPFSFVLNV